MATKKQYLEFMRSKAAKLLFDLNGVVVPSISTENVNNDSNNNSSTFALPFGVLGVKKKRGRGRPPGPKKNITEKNSQNNAKGSVDKIKEIGIRACPQCQLEFDGVNCSPIQEACGHIKCRACFIQSLAEGDNYCHQCELHKNAAVKVENKSTVEIETSVNEKADLIRAPAPKDKSSKCNFQIKPIRINSTAEKKKQSQIKVKTLKLNTFRSQPPKEPPVALPSFKPVIEKESRSKSLLLDGIQSSKINTMTFEAKQEKISISNSHDSAKLVDTGNQNVVKQVPKVTIQIKSKDDQGNVSSAKVKGLNSEKNRKRNPFEIPDHINVIQDRPGSLTLYKCTHCSKKFKTKAHIKYHEFCGENTLEKPYKCDQCGNSYIAKSHYEYHLRTHTGERPYKCPKCGKSFNQQGKVTRHMKSHTGEKPFICQQCGRGFANAQALRSHFNIHTGERPFACQYCNKRFTGMTNLKKHVITHTGEKPYSCTTCGKSFGLKWTLDLHVKTHSKIRPFACNQCTRAFTNSKDLRRHLVIHTGERPFKCWICETAFRRKDNLDRHIKHRHVQKEMSQLVQAYKDGCGKEATHIAEETSPFNDKNQSKILHRGSQEDTSTALIKENTQGIHHIHSPKQIVPQKIKVFKCRSGKKNTQIAEKTSQVTSHPELLSRSSEEDIPIALVSENEKGIPHAYHTQNSINDKLNSVPMLRLDEPNNNIIYEAHNASINEKTSILNDFDFCKIKREVKEAETIVEDLVREALLPSSANNNRSSPTMEAEDQVIQEIFIKQEPIQMTSEMASYVPSQEVTVVHEEDGSTHIIV